jgi:hypothetical protein
MARIESLRVPLALFPFDPILKDIRSIGWQAIQLYWFSFDSVDSSF